MTLADPNAPSPRAGALARAMSWHFWPALDPQDRLLVPSLPSPEYLEYLDGLRLMHPEFVVTSNTEYRFTPFGWNREAQERNTHYHRPEPRPMSEIVAHVNSRAFSLELEAELFPENSPRAFFCADPEAWDRWRREAPPGKWVAKGNHGHAGIAQMRFATPLVEVDKLEKLRRICRDHGGMVLEPEQEISVEFGVLFLLAQDGKRTPLIQHRLLTRRGGGYAGALRLVSDPTFEFWRETVEKAAASVAQRLQAEGYFGPVGMDVYVHRDSGNLRLRPLVDLNARCSMAYPAHGLFQRFPDRAVMVCQWPAAFVQVPSQYSNLKIRLAESHFDPKTRRGAFWMTPLQPGVRRHGIAFVGRDEAEVLQLREVVLQALTHV